MAAPSARLSPTRKVLDLVAELTAQTLDSRVSHRTISPGQLFAGLALLGMGNGLVLPIYRSISDDGLAPAMLDTFGVSAFVWIAMAAVLALLMRSSAPSLTGLDKFVSAIALLCIAIPVSHTSWVALTGVALYLIARSRVSASGDDKYLLRGAIVLLAITGAMFWGRLILQNSGDSVLAADAAVVAYFTGMGRTSNVIETVDGGYIWIAPYCSSLSNISLAVLCSALVVQWRDLGWSRRQMVRCLVAIAAVIVVNDARIAVMVLRPDWYGAVHGSPGAGITSFVTAGAILAAILVRNERAPDRAR